LVNLRMPLLYEVIYALKVNLDKQTTSFEFIKLVNHSVEIFVSVLYCYWNDFFCKWFFLSLSIYSST